MIIHVLCFLTLLPFTYAAFKLARNTADLDTKKFYTTVTYAQLLTLSFILIATILNTDQFFPDIGEPWRLLRKITGGAFSALAFGIVLGININLFLRFRSKSKH